MSHSCVKRLGHFFCFELRFKLIKISFKFVSFWILCIESARLALLYTALAPARVTSYFIKEFMFSQTKHFKETKQWRYFRKKYFPVSKGLKFSSSEGRKFIFWLKPSVNKPHSLFGCDFNVFLTFKILNDVVRLSQISAFECLNIILNRHYGHVHSLPPPPPPPPHLSTFYTF